MAEGSASTGVEEEGLWVLAPLTVRVWWALAGDDERRLWE